MGFDAFGASGPQPSGPKFKITQKNGEACLKRVNTGGPIQDVGYKCVPVRDIKKLEDLKSRLEGRDDQRNLSPAAKQATSAPAPTPKRAPAGKEVDLFNDVNVPAVPPAKGNKAPKAPPADDGEVDVFTGKNVDKLPAGRVEKAAPRPATNNDVF